MAHYDVCVSNIFGDVGLDLISPELAKNFYTQENIFSFPKIPEAIFPIKRGIGSGVLFSEGE